MSEKTPEKLQLEQVHGCFNEAYKFYKERMDKPITLDFWKELAAEIRKVSETKPQLQFELYMAVYDYFKYKAGEK
jgi:hypothetical protein